jgi:hypothetical protein
VQAPKVAARAELLNEWPLAVERHPQASDHRGIACRACRAWAAHVQCFHFDTHEALAAHLAAFLTAYNFTKRLKALRWRTPFQAICDAWARDPTPFKVDPHHLLPGPHTWPLGYTAARIVRQCATLRRYCWRIRR